MENKSNFEVLIKPVIVLVVICIVCSAALAFSNNITAPIIRENEIAATNAAYIEVLPEGTSSDSLTEMDVSGYEGIVSAVSTPDGAYAIKAQKAGYDGGLITLIVGIDADANILGVYSDCSTQTAGMGSKCDSVMTPQLSNAGKVADHEYVLNEDVDQVGGSTVSSEAYVEALNYVINCYTGLKGGN